MKRCRNRHPNKSEVTWVPIRGEHYNPDFLFNSSWDFILLFFSYTLLLSGTFCSLYSDKPRINQDIGAVT